MNDPSLVDRFLLFCATVKLWLESNVGQAADDCLLLLLVFGSLYGVRRFLPSIWEGVADLAAPGGKTLRIVWQSIPSLALTAVGEVLMGGSAEALLGAFLGTIPPLVHHVLKNIPDEILPYRGGSPPAASVRTLKPPRLPLLVLVVAFSAPVLSGCSVFRSAVTAVSAAAPLLDRITAEVERADRVAAEIFRTYPDLPQSARQAYVRGFDGFTTARIHAIETLEAAESLEDGDVQEALELLRKAYAEYMAWFQTHKGMDAEGRLLLPDGSVLSGDPPPPPAAFQLEG